MIQLPLNLFEKARGSQITVELKNGFKYIGKLIRCDIYMNVHLEEVTLIKTNGEKFELKNVVIRGYGIRTFSIDQSLVEA